jgi:hypothetical protein
MIAEKNSTKACKVIQENAGSSCGLLHPGAYPSSTASGQKNHKYPYLHIYKTLPHLSSVGLSMMGIE